MNSPHVIEELQSLVDTGTRVPGFRRKVLVDVDHLEALVEELRSSVPASFEEAEEILKQKESIINQVTLEARRIKGAAEQEAQAMTVAAERSHQSKVDESEIVKSSEGKAQVIQDEAMVEAQQIVEDAQRRAYRFMDQAEASANNRRDGADQYAREILFSLEERLAEVLGQVRRGIDALNLEVETHQAENHVPA